VAGRRPRREQKQAAAEGGALRDRSGTTLIRSAGGTALVGRTARKPSRVLLDGGEELDVEVLAERDRRPVREPNLDRAGADMAGGIDAKLVAARATRSI
jgi:hypothetical protein